MMHFNLVRPGGNMKGFLRRIRFILQIHKSIPFMLDVFRSGEIPKGKKITAIALFLAYVIFPFDIIPDFILFFGLFDELVLLSMILQYFVKIAPANLKAKHNILNEGKNPKNK